LFLRGKVKDEKKAEERETCHSRFKEHPELLPGLVPFDVFGFMGESRILFVFLLCFLVEPKGFGDGMRMNQCCRLSVEN